MIMNRILWVLIFVLAFARVQAQNPLGQPFIKNYSKFQYKGGSQNWGVEQGWDRKMYFGNNEGLLIYDGVYWKLFQLPNKTILRSLKVMPGGKVFVGGQGDFGYFSPGLRGDLVFQSLLDKIPEVNRDFADIWDIVIKGESVFFRASSQIILFQNGQMETFPAPSEWVFLQMSGNTLLAQDKSKGLFFWDGHNWGMVENGNLLGVDIIKGFITVGNDSTILVTNTNKNYLFTQNRMFVYANLTKGVKSQIVQVKDLGNQEYAVATTAEGIFIIDRTGSIQQHFAKASGLQDNNILSVSADKQGNLWAGLNNGISLIANSNPVRFINPIMGTDLSGYAATLFNNQLFLATNDGVFKTAIEANVSDMGFAKSVFDRVAGTNGLAYNLVEVNQQLLLAHNEGAFQIKGNVGIKLSADPAWTFLPTNKVYPAPQVLVGSYTGLNWLDYAKSEFTKGRALKGLNESFRFLVLDNQGVLWSSHPYRGIYRIQFMQDSSRYSTELFSKENGLPSHLDNHVFYIKNRPVFATSKGVFEFNSQNQRFEHSKVFGPIFDSLPIRYLKEDKEGNIWFVSDKRIGYLEFFSKSPNKHSITFFSELTGRILSGFEHVFPYNRENVFISGEKGFIHLNLKKYFEKLEKPMVSLSSIRIVGTPNDSLIYNGFFQDNSTEFSFDLPYKFNSINIKYSESSFGFQDNIEYSYWLKGFDKDWSSWSAKPEKDYTKLPPGQYTFFVKARNNLGNETEMVSFKLYILPPWYLSLVAKVLYFLLFCFGVYLLFAYHRKKLERQRKKFEEKQEQLRIRHQLDIEKNEKEIIRLQNEKLANEVSFKNRELADTSMHLLERNDALNKVKETIGKMYKTNPANTELKKALHLLNDIENNEANWEKFSASFDEINNDFLKRLKDKYPALTHNDQKLCAYLHLNLSSKEIAQLLNISIRGVEISRYRLRKKLGIPTEKPISDFLNEEVKSATR